MHTYIFLDFDGVTHPWGGPEDFRCLPLFESVVREYVEARVVIASDWRSMFSFRKLKQRFAADIQPRIAGVTPLMMAKKGADLHGLREREAMQWIEQNRAIGAGWCAVDDAPGNWLTRERLVLTDYKVGFAEEDAVVLRRLLSRMRAAAG
jgi:hypothetical protein